MTALRVPFEAIFVSGSETDLPGLCGRSSLDRGYEQYPRRCICIAVGREACVIFRLSAGRGFHENAAISKLPSRNYEYRGSYITAIISRTNGNLSARPGAELRAATPRNFATYSLSCLRWEFSSLSNARNVCCSRLRENTKYSCALSFGLICTPFGQSFECFVFNPFATAPTKFFVSVHFSKIASK